MQYTIVFDRDLPCFIVSATGPATVKDIHSFVEEVLRDSRWHSGMNVIVDYSLAELSALTSSETQSLADYIKSLREVIGSGRCAHVVSRTVDYGMIRMWEHLVDDQVSFPFRVFYSMDDARRWIEDAATLES